MYYQCLQFHFKQAILDFLWITIHTDERLLEFKFKQYALSPNG